MKIRKRFAILSAVFLVLSALTIGVYSYASNRSDAAHKMSVSTGAQNTCLAVDDSKQIMVVGTQQNKAIAYDKNGKKLWDYATSGAVVQVTADNASGKLYCGDSTGKIAVLDITSGKKQSEIDCGTRLYSFAVTKDGGKIAISAGPSAAKHYLFIFGADGTQQSLTKLDNTAQAIAFTSDEQYVVMGTNRSELLKFDLSGKQVKETKFPYTIVKIKPLADQKQFVVLLKDSSYRYVTEDFSVVREGYANYTGRALSASPDGKYTFVGNYEGYLYVFNSQNKIIFQTRMSDPVVGIEYYSGHAYITGYSGSVYQVAESDLSTIAGFGSLTSAFFVLSIIFAAAFVVFLILAIEKVSHAVGSFFRAIVKYRTAYLLLLPTFALLLLFNYYPTVIALLRSFTDWSRSTQSIVDLKFVGWDNYKTMFTEEYFFTGLHNLLIIILTNFVKVLTIPLLTALLVFSMRGNREKYWFRFLFVLPMVVPGVVSALMWQNIYDPNIGLINTLFNSWGHPEWTRVWLGDPATAIWAIVFMGFPFVSAFEFLVYYGGLINIPSSLLEAARVDGSNAFFNFFRIEIPLLAPQFKLIIVLTFINSIQGYSSIYLLTGGGPGTATYVPGLELYYNATRFGRYGYACALGVVMFIAILAGTIANMKMQANSEVNYS